MADADAALAKAVALALTGDADVATAVGGMDAPSLPAALAAAGWEPARLQALRRECQEQQLPWPHPVPRELLVDAGFARYGAALAQARRDLGLDGVVPTRRSGPRVIGPAEQRLIDQLPPHHGPVG